MAGIKMVWAYGAHFSFREGHAISVSLDDASCVLCLVTEVPKQNSLE